MENIKELQACQLDIMKELERVCNENGLSFCLAYGSCLGAVRHKGFIPWDDDIDVYMSIEDFQKLNQLKDSFKDGYFLQNAQTDKEYGLMISRVRNSGTTLIEAEESHRDINHGVFVDIYPLFNVPTGRLGQKRVKFNSMIYRLMRYNVPPRNRGKLMRIGSSVLLKLTPKFIKKMLMKHTYKVLLKTKETGLISTLYGDESGTFYPKSWIFPFKNVDFEATRAPIPNDWDAYLKFTYGDYMQLPPPEKQSVHHSYAKLDLNKPYTEYRGIDYCVKNKK